MEIKIKDPTHTEWLENEGGIEGPTHKETLAQSCQKKRIKWLVDNAIGDILEIGCNYGYIVAKAIKKTGGEGIGIDINNDNIKLARQRYSGIPGLYFFEVDVTKAWLNREFDTIMFPDVLEHIPAERLDFILSNAAKATKNRLMITLPWEEKKRHCFKHRWLVDDVMLDTIKGILLKHFCYVGLHCDGDFIYILANNTKELMNIPK